MLPWLAAAIRKCVLSLFCENCKFHSCIKRHDTRRMLSCGRWRQLKPCLCTFSLLPPSESSCHIPSTEQYFTAHSRQTPNVTQDFCLALFGPSEEICAAFRLFVINCGSGLNTIQNRGYSGKKPLATIAATVTEWKQLSTVKTDPLVLNPKPEYSSLDMWQQH